jgi:DNA-binding NarL/FixJ family response regulator
MVARLPSRSAGVLTANSHPSYLLAGTHDLPGQRIQLAGMRGAFGARDARAMALRCFIIDDSSHFLSVAQELLTGEGLEIVGVASTAEEALRAVEQAGPDVVLIDVELGQESGFELARRFQRETSLDRSRVIMISTHAEEDIRELMTSAPVAAFLSKSRLSAHAIRQILSGTSDGS